MDASYNILVIDDDEIIHNLLSSYFSTRNYTVFSAFRCEDADKYLQEQRIDIIILDVVLPGKSGLQLVETLKAKYEDLPVLMLSSQGSVGDRILGLEIGADDYLSKPFSVRELELRIKKLLGAFYAKRHSVSDVRQHWVLNAEHECVTRDGLKVKLTNTETKLLELFINNPNTSFSRDDLSIALYGNEHNPLDRSLDAHINRLRKKIEDDPKEPRYLKTVWGKGYRFFNA
ncbi:MAG: Phosphate regulon transcriptional regulatory protein PhoB (SphR) [uncultured Thiotrichaceae bacterium]|uniref:Phosphate regulon transcriptional regulatory protein PhoB (SphR) n=1 Tax=uncultured Thiotrichaceae bacterium TaxID=298394 RepID=A0A6S6TYU0_9GAMM|nr:MAG: Phosphate regulon transcriptional regulatory protein PhoB (SphR) [uncultured Thiotrichaceae bacterium]